VSHNLDWLPECDDWGGMSERLNSKQPEEALACFRLFANTRMDFVRTSRLDKMFQRYRAKHDLTSLLPIARVALTGSSTLSHLHAGIRLGGLRRGLLVDIYQGMYGAYHQELIDRSSGLYSFAPDVLLLALDSHHLTESQGAIADSILARLRSCWRIAQESLGCTVIQQTLLPVLPYLLGNQESHFPESPAAMVMNVNFRLREEAREANVQLLTVDTWAAEGGVSEWYDAALWYRSKQEVHPRVSSIYGDQVGRILAAVRGKSAKCLVLDLDNTLWGGVVGDDGVDGIVIGEGSENGEAFLAVQKYAKRLSERGVILAVCSKNDERNAVRPFEHRPEMILKMADIACFVANWEDKASNLRLIAKQLNIGLDSFVLLDDNPVERDLIRRELPMVAVPELPEDPAGFVHCLAAAGYFESLSITNEDRERTLQYRANHARQELQETVTDLKGFLKSLKMKLLWSSFSLNDIKRVVQLINKTNQFNLMTRRYAEADVRGLMRDPNVMTLQLRLLDVYGNSGIIALLIAKRSPESVLEVDTWLMSCRVLGRQVEQATLNILGERAKDMGCSHIVGTYSPTASNGMVRNHYQDLGFSLYESAKDGSTRWICAVHKMVPRETAIETFEEDEYGVARDLQAAD
jgi:FkbH-like protein